MQTSARAARALLCSAFALAAAGCAARTERDLVDVERALEGRWTGGLVLMDVEGGSFSAMHLDSLTLEFLPDELCHVGGRALEGREGSWRWRVLEKSEEAATLVLTPDGGAAEPRQLVVRWSAPDRMWAHHEGADVLLDRVD